MSLSRSLGKVKKYYDFKMEFRQERSIKHFMFPHICHKFKSFSAFSPQNVITPINILNVVFLKISLLVYWPILFKCKII